MFISDLFTSIQGEGKYIGTPSIFIRTSYCNLRCQWRRSDGSISRCDTPYTSWEPEKKEVSLEKIIHFANQFPYMEHVVITGGEPFLQEELPTLCTQLQHKFITIETNATIYRPTKACFISLSPKLVSSVPRGTAYEQAHERKRIHLDAIKKFMQHHNYQLKFVISNESDVKEILSIQEAVDAPLDHIYLMPEGKTNQELQITAPITASLALQHGFNYTDRVHIRLWGDKRGK